MDLNEEEKEKDNNLFRIECRRTILNAKIANISHRLFCIHHIEDLQHLSPDEFWLNDGTTDFSATAEIFFRKRDTEEDYFSPGDRLQLTGLIYKSGKDFFLKTPLTITTNINTLNIMPYEDEKNNKT